MERQITLNQYRAIDLGILAAVQTFCQLLLYFAIRFWFPEQLYVASPVAGMAALVMMRWGVFAGIHAALGGLVYAWLSGGTWQHLLIYAVGNLASLAVLPILKHLGKERVRSDGFPALMFGLAVQLLMQLGRAAAALILGYSPEAAVGFITTDALSILLTLLIIWIVRKTDGLFEDQKQYLLRMEQARQAERRDRF